MLQALLLPDQSSLPCWKTELADTLLWRASRQKEAKVVKPCYNVLWLNLYWDVGPTLVLYREEC
eukprot:2893164-Rhodomonas_salina.1